MSQYYDNIIHVIAYDACVRYRKEIEFWLAEHKKDPSKLKSSVFGFWYNVTLMATKWDWNPHLDQDSPKTLLTLYDTMKVEYDAALKILPTPSDEELRAAYS